jgi:RHS repeat-associated protein
LYPGGVSREIAVDGFDRIGRIRVKSPSQSDLMVREYSYDQESNVVNLLSERGSAVYEYDKLNRLIGVSTDVLGMPAERYSYDESGNRLTDSRRPNPGKTDGSWAYNDGNQLLESATEDTGLLVKNSKPIAHKYDAAGSLVLKSTPDGSRELFPTDNQRYVYDAQNRLAEVQDLAGNTIASYQYDPMGRRICKTSYRSWDGGGWVLLPSVQTATYFYVDEGLAAEYAADGSGASRLVAEYGWEPGGQWGVSPVWIKTTRGGNSAHEVFFYQNDHLGVPQIVVDTSGLKVWSQKSTAFGELVLDSENLISSNLRLAGQYFDGETGLNYNYFRSYSPKVGAYAQADPLGLAGGGNIYSYADQSPISKVDPLGLATISGSWLKPPQFNITDKGFDGFEFVEPSWSWYGYVKFIRIHAHANGYVNVDVKCKMTDECDEKEWEIHLKIPAGGKGHADVGPNAYAIGAGFLAGPFVGISLNIIIAGVALLQAELDALQKINQAVRPIIQEVQQKGPTKLCGG